MLTTVTPCNAAGQNYTPLTRTFGAVVPRTLSKVALPYIVRYIVTMENIEPADCDAPMMVCIAHGRFIPCRKDGEHRYTSNPYWVKSVRDYHESPITDLTWEPAWERVLPPGAQAYRFDTEQPPSGGQR